MLAPWRLPSASVRPSAPVCRVLTMAFVKVWRFCTIDRFEPKAEAWLATVVTAVPRADSREASDVLLWNSVLVAEPMLSVELLAPAVLGDWSVSELVQRAFKNN